MDRMTCAACGAALSARDIDRRLAIVGCNHCGAIYDLAKVNEGDSERAPEPREDPAYRPAVPLPERFTVTRDERQLEVSWPWFKPALHIFLALFAVGWDGFLVVWYTIAFGLALTDGFGPAVVMLVFPLIHVAVGIGITYTALTGFFNRTIVHVDTGGHLHVMHTPFPWWPSPKLAVADLEQLYVSRRVNRGKNGTTVTFSLQAITRDHADTTVISGMDSIEQALWLEQEIEGMLGIRDRRVAGEAIDDDVLG